MSIEFWHLCMPHHLILRVHLLVRQSALKGHLAMCAWYNCPLSSNVLLMALNLLLCVAI